MCVLMPTHVLVLVLVLAHQVLVLVLVLAHQVLVLVLILGHQVLVLVLVLESQVLDNSMGADLQKILSTFWPKARYRRRGWWRVG